MWRIRTSGLLQTEHEWNFSGYSGVCVCVFILFYFILFFLLHSQPRFLDLCEMKTLKYSGCSVKRWGSGSLTLFRQYSLAGPLATHLTAIVKLKNWFPPPLLRTVSSKLSLPAAIILLQRPEFWSSPFDYQIGPTLNCHLLHARGCLLLCSKRLSSESPFFSSTSKRLLQRCASLHW